MTSLTENQQASILASKTIEDVISFLKVVRDADEYYRDYVLSPQGEEKLTKALLVLGVEPCLPSPDEG